MAKASTKTMYKEFVEIADFISNPAFLAALEKVGKDKQLFRRAKADPKAYFRDEGVLPPPRADVAISQVQADGKANCTATTHTCWVMGQFKICVSADAGIKVLT